MLLKIRLWCIFLVLAGLTEGVHRVAWKYKSGLGEKNFPFERQKTDTHELDRCVRSISCQFFPDSGDKRYVRSEHFRR